MASRGSIAALLDTSLKRLKASIETIAEATGVEPVTIPTHGRDPELLIAQQAEQMAIFAERLARHLGAGLDDPIDDNEIEDKAKEPTSPKTGDKTQTEIDRLTPEPHKKKGKE